MWLNKQIRNTTTNNKQIETFWCEDCKYIIFY